MLESHVIFLGGKQENWTAQFKKNLMKNKCVRFYRIFLINESEGNTLAGVTTYYNLLSYEKQRNMVIA